MRKAGAAFIAAILSFAGAARAQDVLSATAAASELKTMCEADAGRLWGVDLCGPLLVVDPESRAAWASEPDRNGALSPTGAGWTGALPDSVAITNGGVDWAGQRWIMVTAPLPRTAAERRVLVAQEAWHRAQNTIGVASQSAENAHLNTERGRYLLRMEIRALGTALRSNGRGRMNAAREAWMFRTTRLSEFPDALREETATDRNEGLAAYTGVALGVSDNPDLYAARLLDTYERLADLPRWYAYATGPAYGVLLDDLMPDWRLQLGARAPADLLAYTINAAYDAAVFRESIARYNGRAVEAEERARAETERARIAALRASFGEGPRLELEIQGTPLGLDPSGVTRLDGLGSYYPALTVQDAWGEISLSEGVVLSEDSRRLTAAAPATDGLSGPGWRLQLAPGYQVVGPDLEGVVRVAPIPLEEPATAPPT